jgi:hypothetical protein
MNSFNSTNSNSLNVSAIFPLDISFTPLTINKTTVSFFITKNINTDISLVYTLDSGNTYNSIVVNNQAFDISGFNLRQPYNLRLRTYNNKKYGLFSKVFTFTPYTLPSAPVITSAVGGYDSMTITFTVADNGGNAIIFSRYVYEIHNSDDGGITSIDSTLDFVKTSHTISQIGTYYTVIISPIRLFSNTIRGIAQSFSVRIASLTVSNNNNLTEVNYSTYPTTYLLTLNPYISPDVPTISVNPIAFNSSAVTINIGTFANGGQSITTYKIIYNTTNDFTNIATNYELEYIPPFSSSYNITNLSSGTTYYFRFQSSNDNGQNYSSYSSTSATTVPDPVVINSVTPNFNSLDLNYTLPSNSAPITSIKLLYYIQATSTVFPTNRENSVFIETNSFNAGTYNFLVENLSKEYTYLLTLFCYNNNQRTYNSGFGNSKSNTPYGFPTISLSSTGNGSISINIPSFDGVNTITNYKFSIQNLTTSITTYPSFSTGYINFYTIPNLTNNQLYRIMLAVSSNQGSNYSNYSNQIDATPGKPATPSIQSITAGNVGTGSSTVKINYSGSSYNGGFNLNSYTVRFSTERTVNFTLAGTIFYNIDSTDSNSIITVNRWHTGNSVANNFTAGTTYYCDIVAQNANNIYSEPSNMSSFTPYGNPSVTVPTVSRINSPTSTYGTYGTTTITFTIQPNYGTITSYVIYKFFNISTSSAIRTVTGLNITSDTQITYNYINTDFATYKYNIDVINTDNTQVNSGNTLDRY